MDSNLLYKLALSFIPGIGPVLARRLVAYTGGVEEVFNTNKSVFEKIPGIGHAVANTINLDTALERARRELDNISQNNIQVAFYLDDNYPQSLLKYDDAPLVLYYRGQNFPSSVDKTIAVVGTRRATVYGKSVCSKLISGLVERGYKPVIVSGLAYGIDYCAHKTALQEKLFTVAVLGHGLDTIYPSAHRSIASEIMKNGMLITEYPWQTQMDRKFFVRRNRIIAAIADATVVVESGVKGGALVTAKYALSYGKKVFAVPGRVGDERSEGCNWLIKSNQAFMLEYPEDLEKELGWKIVPVQKKLDFVNLNGEEQMILDLLKAEGKLTADVISYRLQVPVSKVLSILLEMELKGIVSALPGNFYVANP